MQVGIFDHVERQEGIDPGQTYQGRLRLAAAADAAGFACYHVAEHHGTPLSLTPSPNLLLTAIAQRTTRMRLGPLCYVLPLYNPIRLIEEVCMLDHLSGGRLEVGVGRGTSPIEMGLLGGDFAQARDRFAEAFEILKMGLAEGAVTYHGRFYDFDDVAVDLDCVQRPCPPMWYPTSGTASLPWVAGEGMNTVFQGSVDEVAEQVTIYRDHLTQHPARPHTRVGLARYIFVAASEREALATGEAAYAAHRSHLNHLRRLTAATFRPGGASSRMPDNLGEAIKAGWAAVGTPEGVTEQLQAMLAGTGCNYLVYNPALGSTPIDEAIASVETFSREVLPRL